MTDKPNLEMQTVDLEAIRTSGTNPRKHFDAAAMAGEFLRPGDVRITFIARCPWLADGDVVVTDDDPRGAIEALRKFDGAISAAPTSAAGGTTP